MFGNCIEKYISGCPISVTSLLGQPTNNVLYWKSNKLNRMNVFHILVTQTQAVEAVLQCYQCNSTAHPDCSLLPYESHAELLKPCLTQDPRLQGQQPFCRKIYQTSK